MVQHLVKKDEYGFNWIDLVHPEKSELEEIAREYHLHDALVRDCMQPDHLPKFEKREAYNFIIFRVHTGKDAIEADTVQELTNKVAIFYADDFILTIHRTENTFTQDVKEMIHSKKYKQTVQVLNEIALKCLGTFDTASANLSKTVDFYEETIFLRTKKASLLKGLYHLKRKVDLLNRMLLLSYEIVDNIDNANGNENTRNTRDLYVKLQNVFGSLSENTHQLLQIYFSTASQKTNDTMRILTIFSVFFMPLTFIAGIYGMNFEFMPELGWKFGYPGVMLLMAGVTAMIYFWFKRKNWL
jgi:magnesium transporter